MIPNLVKNVIICFKNHGLGLIIQDSRVELIDFTVSTKLHIIRFKNHGSGLNYSWSISDFNFFNYYQEIAYYSFQIPWFGSQSLMIVFTTWLLT